MFREIATAKLPEATRSGMIASIHEWKPIQHDNFVKALHAYNVLCCDEHGHEALSTTCVRLDRETTATFYYMPKSGKRPDAVSSPVLLTMHTSNGGVERFLCFESLKYGLSAPFSEPTRRALLGSPDKS